MQFQPLGEDAQRYHWIGAVLKRVIYRQLHARRRRFARAGRQRHGHPLRTRHRLRAAPPARRLWRCAFRAARLNRHTHPYRARRLVYAKTQPTKPSAIGVRKAPSPEGRPGFIRIDNVHQGDLDGAKGLYHINAVDCATQWQITASVQTISERHLLPLIEQMIEQFPFTILGFHADNGSEYVNRHVAKMLNKLRIEFTRSRPRHSNYNGLAETKKGAVVRKLFGYGHIPQRHAATFNRFCIEFLNPFLNYHRPCLFATELLDPKKPGRIKLTYFPKDVMTPLDKLTGLPNAAAFLRPGLTLQLLMQRAHAITDLQAAEQPYKARSKLFGSCLRRSA